MPRWPLSSWSHWWHEAAGDDPEATEVDNEVIGDAKVATKDAHEAIVDHEAVGDDLDVTQDDNETISDAKTDTEIAHEAVGDDSEASKVAT